MTLIKLISPASILAVLPLPAVRGGANANCLSAPTWIGKTYKLTYGTYTDLNQCQLDALKAQGVKFKPNNNLIGGDGDASLFDDIYIGGGGEGCQSTENCMKDCQALCCIVPNCMYAVIHRDEDTYCPMGEGTCSIYKEDAYYWYCNLYSGGTWKNTDDDTTCYVESQASKSSTCASVAQAGLGFNESTYQSMLYLGSHCTSRNLKGSTSTTTFSSIDEDPEASSTLSARETSRKLAIGADEIKTAVQDGIQSVRGMVLPAVQAAIQADGGVTGYANHIAKTAKSIAKGPGKMGMRKK